MQSFTKLQALVVPINRENVDTDAIIPKQFMKSIKRTGFGGNLFDEWRYLSHGQPGQDVATRPLNLDFSLNQTRFAGAQILLARKNFGCGSSREHAVWALRDYGIRALIAPSFADIFYGNCFKNGLLPICLDPLTVEELFQKTQDSLGYSLTIDLPSQTVQTPAGEVLHFDVNPERKHCLINGLDDIELTLQRAGRILAYEERRQLQEPWLFN